MSGGVSGNGGGGARGGPVPGRRSATVEVLFAALSSGLLFSMFLLLPIAGSIGLALAGVPVVRLTYRRGVAAGLGAALIAAALFAGVGAASGGAAEALAGVLLAAIAIVLPVVFASLAMRGTSPSGAFLALAAAVAVVLSGALLLHEGGRSVPEEMGAFFDSLMPSTPAKGVDVDTAARMAVAMRRFKEFAQTYWLGLAAASAVLAASITFWAGAAAARPAPSADGVRFEAFRIPAAVVALFVASGAGWALLPGEGRVFSGDLLLALSALYFLAGLSIICHFARKWFRSRILRAGLYALVVYFPLNVVVGLLGIFDWYADFRRRGEPTGG